MRIVKKIIRKLYHLIWFLSIFIFSLPMVKADVQYNVPFSITGRAPSSVYTWSDGGYNFTGTRQEGYLNRFAVDFNNSIDGYQFISFYHYNTNNWISTNSNTTLAAPPLISLNRYPCDVTSVGATQNSDNHVGYMYLVLCPVYAKSTNNLEINWVYNDNGYYLHDAGISTTFNGFSSSGDLDELEGINKQMRDNLIASNNKLNSIDQSINSLNETQQETNDKLDGIDSTLNDSSVDSSDSTINNLKNKIPTNSVISDLLLLPVRFLQNFVNALGSSCSRFSLGSLYGTELFMSCINLESYLGSGIWTTIDLIISGLFVYSLRKKFIEIYENLTNLKNGGNEVD